MSTLALERSGTGIGTTSWVEPRGLDERPERRERPGLVAQVQLLADLEPQPVELLERGAGELRAR